MIQKRHHCIYYDSKKNVLLQKNLKPCAIKLNIWTRKERHKKTHGSRGMNEASFPATATALSSAVLYCFSACGDKNAESSTTTKVAKS